MGPSVLTRPFPRVEGAVHCGGVSADELAERFGTPLYVYDLAHIRSRFQAFENAFSGTPHLVAYSVKANGNLSVLRELASLGCGADITSGGELHRALKGGVPAERILFAGVGKTEPEIEAALRAGIYAFNVESRAELERIEAVARRLDVVARFGIRVNPDVFAATPHEYTATGHRETKFGVPWGEVVDAYRWALERPHLRASGIDVHIGSQIVDADPYIAALDRVLGLAEELAHVGVELEYLDLGGGFGISYDGGAALDLHALAERVADRVRETGLRLVLEPGRSIVGEAGVLLTRVEYIKEAAEKVFVIVDSGMTDLIRPSHYGGFHEIEPAQASIERDVRAVDVVGPICETGDFLALDRDLPMPVAGDLLVIRTAGAYGFSMASNYNGRPRAAEVVVDGTDVRLARRRETLEDLTRGEE